jgi:hypothetical protein
MIAGVIGIFGAVLVGLFAYRIRSIWVGIIAFFLFSQAMAAIERTKAMRLQADVAATPPPSPTQQDPPKI